ncbi:MAG: PQQ-binding-like beta-propeller repeat protein [Acidobacteria bacterium]|nr:PQQ-binding-like beta-propeller repeat protein [Acidobacteriota bacterium]MBI3657266.1 PQQ-binding-like beta-propeller repeat protein [Acidobacteriota bacterium]
MFLCLSNYRTRGQSGLAAGNSRSHLTRRHTVRSFFGLAILAMLGLFLSKTSSVLFTMAGSGDILTYHGDNARLGWYDDETLLTPDNVRPDSFGKLWERDLGGQVYGQPLFVHNISIRGRPRDTIYAATMTNRVHALDAETGEWLWPVESDAADLDPRNHGIYLGPPSPYFNCPDIIGPVGVLSAMVIDSVSGTLYVANLVNNRYKSLNPSEADDEHFYLHALDLSTGGERPGWPVEIRGRYMDVDFNPARTNQRGALLLLDGRIYIVFASRCDIRDPSYRGWVFSYKVSNPAEPPQIYSPSVAQSGSGIWGVGGPSADADGNLYIVTGNGDPPPEGEPDLSNSILRLFTRPTLRLNRQSRNYYTPSNQTHLNRWDWDLGGSSVIVLPSQEGTATRNLLFTGGKDGRAYLVDRDFLGGYMGPTRFPNETEDLNPDDPALKRKRLWDGATNGGIKTAPAYFEAADGRKFLYLTGTSIEGRPEQSDAKLMALNLTVDPNSGKSSFTESWASAPVATVTIPVVSSTGKENGIVWMVDARKDFSGRSGDATADSSRLIAYDALTGEQLYWSNNGKISSGGIESDSLRDGRKFSTPIVRDGRVYVGTTGIVAYGLLSPNRKTARRGLATNSEVPNLAIRTDAVAICSVTNPTGNGNRDINAIRQGVWKFCTGTSGYTELNTFNDQFQSSAYFGVRFPVPQGFNELDFQLGGDNDGRLFEGGGWFVEGTVRLEVFDGDRWQMVPDVQWTGYRAGGPRLPEAPRRAPYGEPLRAYDIFKARFPEQLAYGIRIIGAPGQGNQSETSMASCGQIRLFRK